MLWRINQITPREKVWEFKIMLKKQNWSFLSHFGAIYMFVADENCVELQWILVKVNSEMKFCNSVCYLPIKELVKNCNESLDFLNRGNFALQLLHSPTVVRLLTLSWRRPFSYRNQSIPEQINGLISIW